MSSYDTAQNIVNAALAELGLPAAQISANYTDPTGFQALALLQALCDDVVRVHDWQNLEKVMTFTGDGVTEEFALPADYGRQVNQTEWATSDQRPMMGPDSPQVWSWVQYGIVSVGVFFRYRILDNTYRVFPIPAAGEEFALYYISKYCVRDGTDANVYKEKIVTGSDIPLFDRRLLTAGLKVKFWAHTGFDTTVLQREFNYILANEKAQVQGAKVLNLSSNGGPALIGWQNVPDGTYYGI
jgi:hypothetical protein